ncbi:hypothetical protein IQ251_14120 [Saccharopolyspora sp. HNM0983]|uniref:DUF2637 domain-containing protein n=1 Tax=Saccharopolyspora montiporae TaxID=2781240 RepID=A0A929BB87_9PSEU|nr:hypothetical protein [Saccharopolyspora sp. HNM0983]
MIRKTGLFLVMTGALSLSFAGQVGTVRPLLGQTLAVVFALTTDLATLLALNEVTTTGRRAVRFWAWLVLLLAGGTALGLNTWHALQTRLLPDPVAVAVGAGPVVLAGLLSHLMVLVIAERREAHQATPDGAAETVTDSPCTAVSEPPAQELSPAAGDPDRDVVDDTADPDSIPAHPDREEVPAPAPTNETPADPATLPELPERAEKTASGQLPEELIDQAERLERQRLAETGGKRGLAYRDARQRLGVRYGTARDALNAARARMTAADEPIAA